jgi:hypothetical protein
LLGTTAWPVHDCCGDIFACVRERFWFEDAVRFEDDNDDGVVVLIEDNVDAITEEMIIRKPTIINFNKIVV